LTTMMPNGWEWRTLRVNEVTSFPLAVAAVAISAKPGVRPQARALSMHRGDVCGARVEGKDARTIGMLGRVPPLREHVGLSRDSFTFCLGDAVPDFGGCYNRQAITSEALAIQSTRSESVRRRPRGERQNDICRSDISKAGIALWEAGRARECRRPARAPWKGGARNWGPRKVVLILPRTKRRPRCGYVARWRKLRLLRHRRQRPKGVPWHPST
jgi:hypothetical protein